MKENKKGFTLIELLAVIVILAIIALIATPLVMKAINTAREGSAKASANNFVSAVEHSYAMAILEGKDIILDEDNTLTNTDEESGLTIEVKGDKPKSYSLVFSNEGTVIDGTVETNGYTVTIGANGTATEAIKVKNN